MKIEKLNQLIFIFVRLLLVTVLSLLTIACQPQAEYLQLDGFTMGTSYQVKFKAQPSQGKVIHQQIESKLIKINQLMSTYIDDSELSQFNASQSLTCQPISSELFYVIKNAMSVSQQTAGKFDTTVGALIAEWGFDKKQTNRKVPSQNRIKQLLQVVGFNKIKLGNDCIQKSNPEVMINLSAIAKGYAVDQLASILKHAHVEHYLVEIGGETASQGVNSKLKKWKLAIEAPVAQQRQIQQIFSPLGLGVATSGDYRNFFEVNGKHYSHTIDPTTGMPIIHSLVSVTILHPQTMLADAYATALMVMGKEQSLSFAKEKNLAVYLLVREENTIVEFYSQAFAKHLPDNTGEI